MTVYRRVALFFAPESGSDLAEFGASWLGWDVEHGKPQKHPNIEGLNLPISELSATPRKYGFHGTLKAPFRLNETSSIQDLRSAAQDFASGWKRFSIDQMNVSRLGNFVAIIPSGQSDKLQEFAEAVVRYFDDFRAPLNEEEISKRRTAGLTAHQDELMLEWGYPYIFDQFKFHLTLTGKLEEEDAENVEKVLTKHLAEMLRDPVEVVDLCLYGEREDGMFEIIERFPLGG